MDSMSGCEIRPKTVHCSTKNAYTSEITFLALVSWFDKTVSEFRIHN